METRSGQRSFPSGGVKDKEIKAVDGIATVVVPDSEAVMMSSSDKPVLNFFHHTFNQPTSVHKIYGPSGTLIVAPTRSGRGSGGRRGGRGGWESLCLVYHSMQPHSRS
jgi:hypothetical protein